MRNKCRSARLEAERQLDISKRMSLPREEWKDVNRNWRTILGAYHLGRKEALESILSELDRC